MRAWPFPGPPTAATFPLTFDDTLKASPPVAFDGDAAAIQRALEQLPNIGVGNVEVTRVGTTSMYDIKFKGSLGNRFVPLLTVRSSLTGGTSPDVSVAYKQTTVTIAST